MTAKDRTMTKFRRMTGADYRQVNGAWSDERAEAYKNECVRAALEEVVKLCEAHDEGGPCYTMDLLIKQIRALMPEDK